MSHRLPQQTVNAERFSAPCIPTRQVREAEVGPLRPYVAQSYVTQQPVNTEPFSQRWTPTRQTLKMPEVLPAATAPEVRAIRQVREAEAAPLRQHVAQRCVTQQPVNTEPFSQRWTSTRQT